MKNIFSNLNAGHSRETLSRLFDQVESDRLKFIEHCIARWLRDNLKQQHYPDGAVAIMVNGELVMELQPARLRSFRKGGSKNVHVEQRFRDLVTGREELFHNEVVIEPIEDEDAASS